MRFLGWFLVILSLVGMAGLVVLYVVGYGLSGLACGLEARTWWDFLKPFLPFFAGCAVVFLLGLVGVFRIFGSPTRTK